MRKSTAVILAITTILITGGLNNPAGSEEETPTAGVDVVQIDTGWTHTCALSRKGDTYCWGRNRAGRLGIGSTKPKYFPTRLTHMPKAKFIDIGGEHSCAITVDGAVKCWGNNIYGQVGHGTLEKYYTRPTDVIKLGKRVKTVAGGGWHTCVLTDENKVKCWGRNENGRLGDGTINNRLTPTDVVELGGEILQVDAGMDHTCALREDRKVLCWGSNYRGQLGREPIEFGSRSVIPVDILGLEKNIVSISAGWFHNCVLTDEGKVFCWGRNYNGELGGGTRELRSAKPLQVPLGEEVVAINAYSEHTCAITKKGGLKCWGRNDHGQLGDGTNQWTGKPVDVKGLAGPVKQVAVGWRHTCALLEKGNIQCWGYNKYGVFGNNSRKHSFVPVDTRWK